MMPMADVFAPDVNFVSARGVYPTASGGTVASAAGSLNQNTNVSVSTVDEGGQSASVTTMAGTPGVGGGSKGLLWWVGVLLLLLATVFIGRKAGGPEDFRNIRPTFYNFLAITLTAVVGIVGLKVIFGKYRVSGLSDVILSV
jgi:hypothetical protein